MNLARRTLDRRHGALLIAPLLAALLAGCGGGGDAGSPDAAAGNATTQGSTTGDSTSATTGAGTGATAPTTPATPPTGAAADCGLPDFQAQVLAIVNAYRAAGRSCGSRGMYGAAGPLAWNDKLSAAAAGHSQDMAAQNYFNHTSADGRTFSQRIEAQGYAWQRLGENIAAGQATLQAVMDDWIASDGHCANVMEPALTEMGVACVPGATASRFRTYWTMDLGTPR